MRYYWVLLVLLLVILSSFHGAYIHSQNQDLYLEKDEDSEQTSYCEKVPKLCFSATPGSECNSYCESAIIFCCNHPTDVPWTPTDLQNCYNSIYALQAAGCV